MLMFAEDRKGLILKYLQAFDNSGIAPDGTPIIELFDEDAEIYFPKWGIARGRDEIAKLFSDVGKTIVWIRHRYDQINWYLASNNTVIAEGMSDGEHVDGPWTGGHPESGAGRWCDVFEFNGDKISRCYIYLDPDYASTDTVRYPWLQTQEYVSQGYS